MVTFRSRASKKSDMPVSTADQSCERQLRDLAGFAERGGYEVVEVFRETASGMKANRSARAEVMKLAQARHIDAILVTELSRWGRSTQDLLDTLNRLSGWRVSVVAMMSTAEQKSAMGRRKTRPSCYMPGGSGVRA